MISNNSLPFEKLFSIPLRNGLTKPKSVRGKGVKMVNMGEVFGCSRIDNLDMDRVPLDSKERASSMLSSGDLLFARQSLVLSGAGKCCLFLGDDEDVTFESHIIRCRLNQEMAVPAFYFYLFQSKQGRNLIESIVEQVAAAGIRGSDLARLEVPCPPPFEQKRIAQILGALDDKIELNRRMNATLEAIARTLFQSWFVDFDPIKRNAKGSASNQDDSLFPDSFEDSDKALVPKGWIKTSFGQEIDFSTGFAFKSASFSSPGDIRLARGDNVKEGFFHWDLKTRYWPEVTPELERYRLKLGDVLIGMDGSKVGKNWVRVRTCDLPCLLVQRVACLRAQKSIGQHFIWLTVSDPRFRAHVDAIKTGSSIPHISGGQIKAYDFVRPPVGDNRILDRFEEIVGPLGDQIDANIEQIRTLELLRDTLLPRLLDGVMTSKPQ